MEAVRTGPPWGRNSGAPRDGDTMSPLRQEGQEQGLMAMPENSKAVRDGLGLQEQPSDAAPPETRQTRQAGGRAGVGVATGWVQGCGCGSSKAVTRLDVESEKPQEAYVQVKTRIQQTAGNESLWLGGHDDCEGTRILGYSGTTGVGGP